MGAARVVTHGRECQALLAVTAAGAASIRRDAAAAPDGPFDWQWFGERLALHGLAVRFAAAPPAGIPLPPPAVARELEALVQTQRAAAQRAQRTLGLALQVLSRASIDVVLLKGAALARTVHPLLGARPMDDVDLLVRLEDLGRAREALAGLGFGLDPRQLPVFFHRLVHFHLKLQPGHDDLLPIELHWRLHSPALLYRDTVEDLWQRRAPVTAFGVATARLGAVDEFLHLATHLASHFEVGGATLRAEELAREIALPRPGFRLRWLVDLVEIAPGLWRGVGATEVAKAAARWNAGPTLGRVLATLVPLLDPQTADEAADLAARLSPLRGSAARMPVADDRGRAPVARPHPALDFRLASLRRLGGWIVPPQSYFAAGEGSTDDRAIGGRLLARVIHAARVLLSTAVAAVMIVPAIVVRTWQARRRRALFRRAREPAATFEVICAARALETAFPERFGGGT